jgi:hypothetical protein
MKTIDFSYFIESFNAGEMNQAEKVWFLKELNGNESLQTAFFRDRIFFH